MIEISDKKHVSTIIESINKAYKRARINGKLLIMDVYYINIIKQLLDNDVLDLTVNQKNTLISLYTKFSLISDNICSPRIYKSYQTNKVIKFEQAEVKDCNTYNAFPKIYYWQEEFIRNEADVLSENKIDYLDDKLFDTYTIFESGKDITYTYVGLICFFATDSLDTDSFIIKDSLGNNVTHTFNITYDDVVNGMLFVSQNKYTNSTMNFKIIKQ